MTILSQLVNLVRGARASLAGLDMKLHALDAEQAALDREPPHRDDLIEAAVRSLDAYAAVGRQRLRWYWGDDAMALPHAHVQCQPMRLLEPSRTKPSFHALNVGGSAFDHTAGPADASVLVLLLNEAMRRAIPGVVAELVPDNGGLRAADRRARQAKIDGERQRLLAERDALAAELDAARRIADT